MSKLINMAMQLLSIYEDIKYRTDETDFEIHDFDQIWGSTALGFPGMGGQAITCERTWVLIPESTYDCAYVYFGGRFAYKASMSDRFVDDLRNKHMASVMESGRYKS